MHRVLITGAATGIGLALVRGCLARGDRVLAGVRDLERADALVAIASDQLTVVELDVACPDSIAGAVSRARAEVDGLDLLVNNAGIHAGSPEIRPSQRNLVLGALEPEGILRMVRVNAVGPALVTQAMLDLLLPSARVLCISSRRGAIGPRRDGGNYAYCASKAALNMVARTLAADLQPRGVICVAVHPGRVRTRMGVPGAELSPDESAAALLALSDTLTLDDAGRFLCWDGSEHPW